MLNSVKKVKKLIYTIDSTFRFTVQTCCTDVVEAINESYSCATVILSGPPGVGKSTVIKSVAKRCRLNVKEFNCYDFFSEGLKVAEQKLAHAFDKAIDYIPCVMVLKEIHVLTKQDLSVSAGSHEPRIDTAFEQHIADISHQLTTSNYPFIVVGVTSSPNEVSPRIQHCFLHELPVKPPTQDQRVKLIQGFTLQYPITQDVDAVDLARRSAGFVLGDYQELFSKAHKLAVSEISTKMRKYVNNDDLWLNELHMSIFGPVIDKCHMDSALNQLHTQHSGYIGAPKIPNVKWKDVGGLEEAKKEILETIQLPLLHPELFVGDLRRSGILLYGAPGTGKTLLAKAVATECSLNFLSVKGPELINMYVGQTEENIREIFARARGAAPCVVFFDELDSLAPNRGKSGDSGGVMDRVVSQLLAELDGLDQKKDVFVIGATNRPDLIDPALLRPGRFDRLVYLDVCGDVDSKLTILKAITRKFKLHEDVDLLAIAETCPANLTGADLYALCADSMLASLRRQINHLETNGLSDAEWEGSLIVCQNDFMTCLDNLTPSVTKEELEMYRKKQFLQNIN